MGQVFIYILSIVVVVIILSFGYKSITSFKEKSEEVAFIEFKNGLTSAVKSISSDYGSVVVKSINIPSDYKEVCFVNTYDGLPSLSNTGHPMIESSVNNGMDDNVFLVTASGVDRKFEVGSITVSGNEVIGSGLLCISVVSGKLKVRLEGKGNHADIS